MVTPRGIMFVDRVIIELIAGKGGNGVVAWRREKYIPKGGPAGGNGGRGGSVILEADTQISSLDWFRHRRILKAQSGGDGGGNCRQGKNGTDLILKVPCGTLLKDAKSGKVIHDFVEDKERFVLCKGGRGGRGNDSFKTPTHQAPNICTEGTLGEIHHIELELKLIADVGLVGFPNAGKSTLISSLAGLRVKVAAYPFTTLQPNLGFIELDNYKRIYIADIPGIIEGASHNRGLGLEFLRHIERTKLLIFILDASGIDGRTPSHDFRILREEIGAYNPELLERPYLVVLNKIDTEDSLSHIQEFEKNFSISSDMLFKISAVYGEGLQELIEKMTQRLSQKKEIEY
ncbi:GTPase obg [Candidatus Protochlamydia amoebophila]|uniref:GTPase Obg n=2 Tax=Candidatus Protochlamydia amoebophila TaxID=362787 RepID=A0A0C1K3M9_9BACT|nr:GTPase obg [Candidatus Protochlamydia amoebophila]